MIELRAGAAIAVVAPDLGGSILSLSHQGRDVLRPSASRAAVAADPREAACYPCVPWFGRLFGPLTAGGKSIHLAPTLPACDPDHALHGHGWVNPWTVTARSDASLTCAYRHAPEAGQFPFPFECRQQIALAPGRLAIELSLINTGAAPMPAGLGLHPFFPRSATTRLRLDGPANWMTPGGAAPPAPAAFDLTDGALPESAADLSAADWSGRAHITDTDYRLTLESNAPILHLYAPAGASFFCAEPITHLPGAFGADMLAANAAMRLTLSLSFEIA